MTLYEQVQFIGEIVLIAALSGVSLALVVHLFRKR